MNRNDLEVLGLTKEQISSVLDKHHEEVNGFNAKISSLTEQVSALNDDLSAKSNDIKELSTKSQSAEELQKALGELQSKYDNERKAYSEKIDNMEFNSVLDSAITSLNGRNNKAVKALLDIDSLKSSKNRIDDINSAIKSLSESEDTSFLFKQAEAQPVKQQNIIGSINSKPTTNYLDDYYKDNPFYKK